MPDLNAPDVSASDLAAVLADSLRGQGAQVGGTGVTGPSRFDLLRLRLPNGQEFTIKIEEN